MMASALALMGQAGHAVLSCADDLVSWLQTLLYVNAVQPLLFRAGMMDVDEDTYDALYWVIVGVLEVGVMYALLRPLEALAPVEKWRDRKGVGVDALYTWITRLGIVNLLFFFTMQPFFDRAQSALRLVGVKTVDLDNLWPGVTTQPLVAFAIYLVVLDLFSYWYHRLSHRFGIWWELHAVHHSHALSRSVKLLPYISVPLRRSSRARPWTTTLPTARGCGQPPDGGSLVAHRLPASFAFGLTRRYAACPNEIEEQDPVLTPIRPACQEGANRVS